MDRIHICLKKGQKVFLTSDLHFGHKNILDFCKRPFADIKEMSEKLIENWNSVVGEDDIVLDTGDVLWFDGRHDAKRVLEKLNGKHYIIQGNHDRKQTFELCNPTKISVLESEAQVWIEGLDCEKKVVELFLSHCPMMTWPHRGYGVPNFFGHIHTKEGIENMDSDLPLWPLQYDIGVDNNNYRPIELIETLRKIGYFKES